MRTDFPRVFLRRSLFRYKRLLSNHYISIQITQIQDLVTFSETCTVEGEDESHLAAKLLIPRKFSIREAYTGEVCTKSVNEMK